MLKFLCKLVNFTRSCKRKHKGMFFSGHSVVPIVAELHASAADAGVQLTDAE